LNIVVEQAAVRLFQIRLISQLSDAAHIRMKSVRGPDDATARTDRLAHVTVQHLERGDAAVGRNPMIGLIRHDQRQKRTLKTTRRTGYRLDTTMPPVAELYPLLTDHNIVEFLRRRISQHAADHVAGVSRLVNTRSSDLIQRQTHRLANRETAS